MNQRFAQSFQPRLSALAAALLAGGLFSPQLAAAPEGGVVRTGSAAIQQAGGLTRIDQASDRAVIDWRGFGVGTAEQVLFRQPTQHSATLNRVTGEQVSVILGRIDANGQVFLVNPNGIIVGAGAQINVGSLVASTANIANANFMAGRMVFDQPGKPGAGIVNRGQISAAQGGLVALVAPHVRNDGLIQARLGKVVLGAGDSFTLDLYGDGLISLALSQDHAGNLLDAEGNSVHSLIAQAGRIEADGGQVVLMSAPVAKAVLDQVINLSGSIRADTVAQQGGRILLLARGGSAEVSGSLTARGEAQGQIGGGIEVLGDRVHLGPSASQDASGDAGGGTVHVGGAYRGQGDTWRAAQSTVDDGARIAADALRSGNGGEVVVWADGRTGYAGSVSARGGANGGDGGRVEISGKGTLDFAGTVDAGAAKGAAGSLLLDPAVMNIGPAEAGLIRRVLRTGTSTAVSADIDININSAIDGRGRNAGGGLTLNAGNDINVNDFIVTNNGAVNLNAGAGTVRVTAGKGVFAGSAPIAVRTGGNLSTSPMITSGPLSFTSAAGSVSVDTPIDAGIGPVSVTAAQNVSINQPVVNLRNGSGFSASASGDVLVNAQIDGRGGNAGGGVSLSAGGSVRVNEFVVTNLGAIRARAIAGTVLTAPGKGLFANGGAIDLASGADLTTGILTTTGPVNLASTGGSVTIGQGIDGSVGRVSLQAAADANLDTEVLNLRSGNPLEVSAGRDINVRAQVDGRGRAAGGSATLSAGRNVNVLDSITTNEGAIRVAAAGGTVIQAAGAQLRSGAAPISVSAGGDLLTASYVTTGALDVRSTAGSVTVAEPIYDTTGATTVRAATDVNVNALVENVRTLASLDINAGRDINANKQIGQDRDALTDTGPIALTAGRDVNVGDDVVSRSAPLTVQATGGTVRVAAGKQLRSGTGTLSVTAGGDLFVGNPALAKPNSDMPYVTTGALNVTSTSGTLFIEAPIPDSTGRVNLVGGNAVVVNERIYSNNQDITITGGPGGIVMSTAHITVPDPTPSDPAQTARITLSDIDARRGNLTLTAAGNINAPSVRTAGVLRITSTGGRILGGTVVKSHHGNGTMPQQVFLAGALGIDGFDTRSSPDVEARSSAGSVGLNVFAPARLYIQAAQDVSTGGFVGQAAELVAGRDVRLSSIPLAGLVRVNAGQDFLLNGTAVLDALKAGAGRDILFPTDDSTLTWIEGPGGNMTLKNPAALGTVETLRGLSLTAGNDVVVPKPVHVSDSLTTGTESSPPPTALSAGRNLTLGQLETIGDVSLGATTGNITVTHPIGAPVPVVAPAPGIWNPTNLGVASLTISAPGTGAIVSLQGARSEGSVRIEAPNGGTVNSTFAVTSSSGTPTIVAPTQNISATPIPPGARMKNPGVALPVAPPGPLRAAPPAPPIPAAPPPAAPGLAEILVSAPDAIDAGSLSAPGFAGADREPASEQASAQAARVAAAEAETATDAASGDAAAHEQAAAGILLFSGGRGLAQSADLGRSGSFGSALDLNGNADEERKRRGNGRGR
jgi:filamentous hemagglutinin family protein